MTLKLVGLCHGRDRVNHVNNHSRIEGICKVTQILY